jgi:enoyl-CoA hydratase/carnithine racemase
MNHPAYQLLSVTHSGGVASITLNHPARRNAIGPRMVNELLHALGHAGTDDQVRSIVLTGTGDAFCAGGDFSQMSGAADAPELEPKGDYADLLLAIVDHHKPVVARVNGHALGGGLGLVAASHLAVATSKAKLGTPEINVGLFPMMIMALLQRLMPRRALVRMMLLGQRLSAAEALELGLLTQVVDASELDGAVASITEAIAAKSPVAVAMGLEALAAQDDLPLEEALPLLRERLGRILATEDAREGLTAFLEKRKPVWKGR